MKVDILGVKYSIKTVKSTEINGDAGECDFYTKVIKISNFDNYSPDMLTSNKDAYSKECVRHEIIHAYLYESGLAHDSSSTENWATNEEMIDWLAIQMPKIYKSFEHAGCL